MNRREFNAGMLAAPLLEFLASTARAQSSSGARPKVGMLIHNDMILLDLVGPLTVFNIMQAELYLVSRTMQPVIPDVQVPITPSVTFDNSPKAFDVLFVPGASKARWTQ
ncbi:hypothetical protein MTR72_24645 [Bradyrhizobium sp. ISRA442]|uniref:hypothetical protein n=1 Tax=Bradyrhizobium sp. ISRA442 TaxID=2866197 RepID=UPI00311ADC8C